MSRTARTPVKGNAHNCEMDDDNHDTGTKKKTSKERNDEMNRVCTADSREICRTCRLRVVEAKEMGIECYVCVESYLKFLLLLLNKLSFSDTTVIEGGRERKHS